MEQRDANLKFRAFLVYLRSANLVVLSIFHNHLVYDKGRIKLRLTEFIIRRSKRQTYINTGITLMTVIKLNLLQVRKQRTKV